jgi:hypothetical protein
MKTTVEISPALLAQAKKLAPQRGTTLRALIEAGLRHVLADEGERRAPYRLPDARVNGQGVQPGRPRAHTLAGGGTGTMGHRLAVAFT